LGASSIDMPDCSPPGLFIKVQKICSRLNDIRFMRFLVAGGVNTLFGFALYGVAAVLGAKVWLALLVSVIGGVIFNFITTGGYAFRQLMLVRLPRFVTCYVAIYCVNLVLLEGISMFWDEVILIQLILSFPMAILSYLLLSNFVFRASSDS
jgi:putative flippase GtrA